MLRTLIPCSLAIVTALRAVGCGGDDEKKTDAAPGSLPPAATSKLNGATSKEQETDPLRRVVLKFARAVGAKDYRAACQTRTPAERQALTKAHGSCPEGFAAIAKTEAGKNFDALGTAEIIYVEKLGPKANVGVGDADTALVIERLRAKRIGGRWLLVPR